MSKRWILLYILLLFLPFLLLLLFLPQEPEPETPPGETVTLYRHETGTAQVLELTDYLWGVVAGEMPASYPEEALKAQTVASYTYLLHRKNTIASNPSSDFGHIGDVCDDPNHCKAYLSPAEAILKWGEDWYDASYERIRSAVTATAGKVLLYQGTAANTVFHAISGGMTEDAADVWGAEVPYLVSVDSHWDREAKGFSSVVTVPLTEFCEKIGQTDYTPGATVLTSGGSVATQVLGDKTFTGRELRSLFSLRSTRFTLKIEGENAVFNVSGYGHQVGMSQYGASVLAANGYTYDQILAYYYPGTSLKTE
ncbi:MAG: stage II sporulation protein D [Clostridia bacterium]|nr:stage II sporulation protein D [Clostridia bacterium]